MYPHEEVNLDALHKNLMRLRGNPAHACDASIVIPVNAQVDLQTVLQPLGDIIRYTGKYTIEVILVINNYSVDDPPAEIAQFHNLGIHDVTIPSAQRQGETIIISARALGVRAAKSNITIHFDADCRVPDIDSLLDWYIESLHSNAQLAYSHVGFYDVHNLPSIHANIAIHHTVRWIKRNLLHIPTTRGSNYAIDRSLFLRLYDTDKLSVDLQVGPAAKLAGARIIYSGHASLKVFTSGRRYRGGWIRLIRYLFYRLHFNFRAIPTRRQKITRTSWEGFDQENEIRQRVGLPIEGQASDAEG